MNDQHSSGIQPPATELDLDQAEREKRLTLAAKRALEEARLRREAATRLIAEGKHATLPKEKGGQSGPEPTRYGDWERKGIISDF